MEKINQYRLEDKRKIREMNAGSPQVDWDDGKYDDQDEDDDDDDGPDGDDDGKVKLFLARLIGRERSRWAR